MGERRGFGLVAAAASMLIASASSIITVPDVSRAAGPAPEPSRSNRRRQSSGSLAKILATTRHTGRR